MEEQKETNSEENFEEMFSKMGNFMLEKLKQKIENINKKLVEIKKSDRKNKDEVAKKFEESIVAMTKMVKNTELTNKIQKEMLGLMGDIDKLDNEIENLLIKDGE